jgi:hypothetical protein
MQDTLKRDPGYCNEEETRTRKENEQNKLGCSSFPTKVWGKQGHRPRG